MAKKTRSGRRAFLATLLGVAIVALAGSGSLQASTGSGADAVLVDLSYARAAIGTPYTYAYEIDGHGPDAATGVGLTAVLKGSFSFGSASSDVGSCTYTDSSHTVDCDVGGLAPGASATVEITVTPSGAMSAGATVASTPGEDPDTSNNGADTAPQVLAAGSADLWVYPNSGIGDEGVGSSGYAVAGQPYPYSVDVVNYGPAVAEDVMLSIVLPTGGDLQDADPGCTAYEDEADMLVTCALGELETSRTVHVTAIAPLDSAGQTIRTAVFIDGSGPDPGPQPNDSSTQLAVVPGLSGDDSSGSEAAPTVDMPVELSDPLSEAVTVDYATSEGTALAGADYEAVSGTLTFPAGETLAIVSVPVLPDDTTEADETFTLTLSNLAGSDSSASSNGSTASRSSTAKAAAVTPPAYALVRPEARGTILDDDPKVRIGNVRVVEGNKGARKATFKITLSHASPEAVTARFSTKNGTARAGSDYIAVRRKAISFLPGQLTQTVTVRIKGDRTHERKKERFFGKLSSVAGAVVADAKGIGTIIDQD